MLTPETVAYDNDVVTAGLVVARLEYAAARWP